MRRLPFRVCPSKPSQPFLRSVTSPQIIPAPHGSEEKRKRGETAGTTVFPAGNRLPAGKAVGGCRWTGAREQVLELSSFVGTEPIPNVRRRFKIMYQTKTSEIKPLAYSDSRTRSITFTALSIAVMAVSAWITIPIGPVPFTLQMFAVTLAILVLTPKQAIGATAGYLALGAIGVPVFSGMRGGIGVLMGFTGGFLWGYLIGVSLAVALLAFFRSRGIDNFGVGVASGLVFTFVAYACGWLQYMVVAGVGPVESLLVTVAPFVVVDIIKIVAATAVARVIINALSNR